LRWVVEVDESANVHRDVKDGVRSEDLLCRSDIVSEMLYMCIQSQKSSVGVTRVLAFLTSGFTHTAFSLSDLKLIISCATCMHQNYDCFVSFYIVLYSTLHLNSQFFYIIRRSSRILRPMLACIDVSFLSG